jgi:hypothetical protein
MSSFLHFKYTILSFFSSKIKFAIIVLELLSKILWSEPNLRSGSKITLTGFIPLTSLTVSFGLSFYTVALPTKIASSFALHW